MMRWLISIICCGSLVTGVFAQDAGVKDISLLGKLEYSLITWFDKLSQSVDQIADKEDQRNLKSSLKKLQGSIYEVETNGGTLVTILRTKPLDEPGARKSVADTRNAVMELQKQLHATGLDLRNQYRTGGADAEKMIAGAIGQRSVWLSDVEGEIAAHHISEKTIEEGSAILGHQRTASMAVYEVIEKMP
jgi:hypothetical protein